MHWNPTDLQHEVGTLRRPDRTFNDGLEHALRLYQLAREKECEIAEQVEGELLVPNASKLIPKGYKIAMRDSG